MSMRQKGNARKKIDEAVASFLDRHGIASCRKIAVAFSGGADSLSLLLSLSGIFEHPIAIYVNHHLRSPQELECEISLNRSNAAGLGVELVVLDADADEIASLSKSMGVECAARQVRYRLIQDYCKTHGVEYVFTAHNRDDCDESDMINFFRGGSLERSVEEVVGNICRPLLSVSHEENERNVAESGLVFSQDSTNMQSDALRTSIRHRLKPVLDEVFPSYSNALLSRRMRRKGGTDDHSAVFSAFSLLGYRSSNNNRIKRRSVDGILDLACNGSNSGRLVQGDVVVLHRKGSLALVRHHEDGCSYDVFVENEGSYDLPCSGRAIVSVVRAGFMRESLTDLPTDCILVAKRPFHIRRPLLDDRISYEGKDRTARDIMKRKQVSAELMSHVRALVADRMIAMVFEGLDVRPCVADNQNISGFSDEDEMFMVMFV